MAPSNHDHDGHCEEPAENHQHMSGLTGFASWCLVKLRPPRPNRPVRLREARPGWSPTSSERVHPRNAS